MKCWIDNHMRLRCVLLLVIFLFISFVISAKSRDEIDSYKAVFTAFPKHTPSEKAVDAPITGNGDIGLTMAPSRGKVVFYVGKNDFWKAVESIPEGRIALPGGLTLTSDIIQEEGYYAEQLPGSAELRAIFKHDKEELNITAWVVATDNIIIIELESERECRVNLNLWVQCGSESSNSSGIDNGCLWVHRSFDDIEYLKWPTYMAMAMNELNGDLILLPGRKKRIVLSIYTNHDTTDWHNKAVQMVSSMTEESISHLKKKHQEWWDFFWSLSSVSIDDEFLEKYYYQSQYIFACASREDKFAPGLWGPFITSDEPAWRGDYHLNYNYEEPYWAQFSSNHICLTENYEQPMLDYMEMGRQHAINLLNCKGILYPVGLGPKGLCSSAWPKIKEKMKSIYGFDDNSVEDGVGFWKQKTNASFVASNMMMHFYSTYDKDYAKKVYPFIRACADFWEDYLVYESGRYVVKGDVFNETMPWEKTDGDFNCTLSLGMIRMTFQGVEALSSILNIDRKKRSKWKDILDKLSDYPLGINSRGNISMTYREMKGEEASGTDQILMHGLSLPTGVTGPNLTPRINAVMLRDLYGFYTHDGMDWGNTMNNGVGTVYASAARIGFPAEMLLKNLKQRIMMGGYPNCYIVAGGGGIETTSAVPGTINEMMLQSYEGIIRVFPNWDKSINGSFTDLRAYGAFLVSSSIKDGYIGQVTIKSEKGRPCQLENPWPSRQVRVIRNGKKWKIFKGNLIHFKTKPGDVFILDTQ